MVLFKRYFLFLGSVPTRGLWGIKNTRKPVDSMVTAAKNLPTGKILPYVKIVISTDGLSYKPLGQKNEKTETSSFKVDVISYGVQDIIYTRVFSMIVVKEGDLKQGIPFTCHAFVCESKNQARQLTYALAAAFQDYGSRCKEPTGATKTKKFAIDLRTPEEIENASDDETEA